MKKIISLLLAVLLMVSVMYQMPVSAAEDEPTFAVSSVQAKRGERVSVTIRIDHNPGVASVRLKAQFDSALTLNSITYNTALGGRSQQPETFSSPVTLNWFNGEANTMGDMTYATLEFTVAQNASVGLHPISVTYDEDDVYNIDEENIPFKTVSGGVTVVIPVRGIRLNPSSATVSTGDGTFTLTPTFAPSNATNRKVTWTSSDISVATVSDGVVTLLKKGTAVITVKSDEGGFEATCTLTVLCSHLTYEAIPAEASTCIKQGHAAYTVCKECGEVISGSDALLPFAEHQFEENPRARFRKSDATCISPRVYYKSCSVCNTMSTETFAYGSPDPNNHVGDTHLEGQTAPSCSHAGYTGDVVCDDCGKTITKGSVIAKLAHTPSAPVRENEIPASCTVQGSYDEVVYCGVCHEELSREHKTIPATGHTYGAPVWTWNGYSSATAVFSCIKGDDQRTLSAKITSSITKTPTLMEEGERTYRATVTFEGKTYTNTKTAVLPKLYILGDVDSNGDIEVHDATWIQRHIADIDIPFSFRDAPADVNGDGEVTLLDVTYIQKHLANMNTPYRIGETIE